MNLTDMLHGAPGLVFGYGMVLLSMLGGMLIARPPLSRFLQLPILALPVLIAGLVAGQLFRWAWLYGSPIAISEPLLQTLTLVVIVIVGVIAGIFSMGFAPRVGHERGAVVLSGRDAQAMSRNLERAVKDKHALTIAGITVPPEDEPKHFKMVGTTGTGKSTAIRELMDGALRRGDRAVFADPDGGYTERYFDAAQGDVILNPFDTRSARWNVFAEIQTAYDADQIARSLIAEVEGAEASWRNYARIFLAALLRQLHAVGVHDMRELWRLVSSAPVDELRILLQGTPAAPFVDPDNARMFGSIRSVATSTLAGLEYLADQDPTAPAFSVRQWVGQGRGTLYLPYRADQIAALRSVIATWVRLAIFATMSLPEVKPDDAKPRRVWFIVDELDALGAIDGLKDALARLRKFGGRCVLGFQSIAQVSGTYGQAEARTIVENCGTTLVLRCSASEGGGTARFAADLIGQREVTRITRSESKRTGWFAEPQRSLSTSEQRHTELAVMASEFEALPDLTGYLKIASQPVWLKVSLEWQSNI